MFLIERNINADIDFKTNTPEEAVPISIVDYLKCKCFTIIMNTIV